MYERTRRHGNKTFGPIQWAEQTLAKSVVHLEHFVIFLDNLSAKETGTFKKTEKRTTHEVTLELVIAKEEWGLIFLMCEVQYFSFLFLAPTK